MNNLSDNNAEAVLDVWNYPVLDTMHNVLDLDHTVSMEEEQVLKTDLEIERDSLQQEFSEKLNYLDSMGHKLKEIITDFETNLLKNTLFLIKKIAKKVLLIELKQDDGRLVDMVNDAIAKINKDGDSCVVFVSPEDCALFDPSTFNLQFNHITIKTDPILSKGDFRIKSSFTELESNLESRLNKLLGL